MKYICVIFILVLLFDKIETLFRCLKTKTHRREIVTKIRSSFISMLDTDDNQIIRIKKHRYVARVMYDGTSYKGWQEG
jgi:ABC-type siderophore export system fused ATPase/permease subunit